MDSTVKVRPNHYVTLGLAPSASADDIARAYAREISPFRPKRFGGIADVSLAYEVLRDPARRRAYDEALGLLPEPKPAPPSMRVALSGGARFIGAALPAAPAPEPQAEREAPPRANPRADVPIDDFLAAAIDEARRARDSMPAFDWKRPGIVVAALVVGVAATGALAGMWSHRDLAPHEADVLPVALTPQKPLPALSTASATPASVVERAPVRPARVAAPARAARAPVLRRPQPQSAELRAGEIQPIEIPAALREAAQAPAAGPTPADAVSAPAPVAADSASSVAAAAAAAMPLSNKVIARTIERIGYSCGDIASTAPLDGQPGAFKITCSSGKSFKAAPVGGRYHFRRIGG